MNPTLVILAAGMGSRYGGLKQVDPVGPHGTTIMDYAVYDALAAGFNRVVFVIRREFEEAFQKTVGAKYAEAIDVAYAFQSLTDLPDGYNMPAERSKPWGTAHAIRAARKMVNAPFAAINADDFYGRDAFQKIGDFLAQESCSDEKKHFAMVGYRLDQTLSRHGSVARGICQVAKNGTLLSVQEMTRLVPVAGGAENREDPGQIVHLSGSERVSLNLWGFTPALFDELEARFPVWLSAHANDLKAEWYIPFVVDEMIREKRVDVQVLPTESAWFGVTYREDKAEVMAVIQALVQDGTYPEKLW